MQKVKALFLMSGGLDSMLAVKLLQIQGIEVIGVCFTSNFFSCEKAEKAAQELKIKLKIIDISKELLQLVKNPSSGYGKYLNPCIDCHSLMVKETAKIAKKEKYHIIATGEVLGQRPFSQTKQALTRVEKQADTEIVRPLSAKKLAVTIYEKQGLVNRGRLLNFSGRSREQQIKLAEKYKLKYYATPAGGCLLADPEFSQRLGKMLDYWPECTTNDVELLKHGRLFWLKLDTPKNTKEHQKILLIVGRHQQDNEKLEQLAQKHDLMVELKEMKGPLTIVRISNFQFPISKQILNLKFQIPNKLNLGELQLGGEKSEQEIINIAGLLTGYYATKARGRKVELIIKIK